MAQIKVIYFSIIKVWTKSEKDICIYFDTGNLD